MIPLAVVNQNKPSEDVIIDVDIYASITLDEIYRQKTGKDPARARAVRFVIKPGVTVMGNTTTGTVWTGYLWPEGTVITVINYGSVIGMGGDGSNGSPNVGTSILYGSTVRESGGRYTERVPLGGGTVFLNPRFRDYVFTILNYGFIGGGGGGGVRPVDFNYGDVGWGTSVGNYLLSSSGGYDTAADGVTPVVGYVEKIVGGMGGGGAPNGNAGEPMLTFEEFNRLVKEREYAYLSSVNDKIKTTSNIAMIGFDKVPQHVRYFKLTDGAAAGTEELISPKWGSGEADLPHIAFRRVMPSTTAGAHNTLFAPFIAKYTNRIFYFKVDDYQANVHIPKFISSTDTLKTLTYPCVSALNGTRAEGGDGGITVNEIRYRHQVPFYNSDYINDHVVLKGGKGGDVGEKGQLPPMPTSFRIWKVVNNVLTSKTIPTSDTYRTLYEYKKYYIKSQTHHDPGGVVDGKINIINMRGGVIKGKLIATPMYASNVAEQIRDYEILFAGKDKYSFKYFINFEFIVEPTSTDSVKTIVKVIPQSAIYSALVTDTPVTCVEQNLRATLPQKVKEAYAFSDVRANLLKSMSLNLSHLMSDDDDYVVFDKYGIFPHTTLSATKQLNINNIDLLLERDDRLLSFLDNSIGILDIHLCIDNKDNIRVVKDYLSNLGIARQ